MKSFSLIFLGLGILLSGCSNQEVDVIQGKDTSISKQAPLQGTGTFFSSQPSSGVSPQPDSGVRN